MKKPEEWHSQHGGGKGGKKPQRTPARQRAWHDLGGLSRMWNELTEEQRTAWRQRARDVRSRVRKGHSYPLDGHKVFIKVNTVVLLLGRQVRTDPPPLPQFGPNPVGKLRITGAGKRMTLQLEVSGAPAGEVMVYGSPPWPAGREYCGDFRFLGLLPAPIEGMSDIKRLYISEFGVPPPNTRIFIRAWQEADGWENRGAMQITSALVPREGGTVGGQKGGRGSRKKE